jgi:hypothetical protein
MGSDDHWSGTYRTGPPYFPNARLRRDRACFPAGQLVDSNHRECLAGDVGKCTDKDSATRRRNGIAESAHLSSERAPDGTSSDLPFFAPVSPSASRNASKSLVHGSSGMARRCLLTFTLTCTRAVVLLIYLVLGISNSRAADS